MLLGIGPGERPDDRFCRKQACQAFLFYRDCILGLYGLVLVTDHCIYSCEKEGEPMQLKSTATSSDAETPADTNYFRIPERWLKRFPRLIGFSCLLLIELAVLQLKVYEAPALSFEAARGIFIILFLGYLFLK